LQEAIDLGYFDFPEAKAVDQMLGIYDYDFIAWDKIVNDMEDDVLRAKSDEADFQQGLDEFFGVLFEKIEDGSMTHAEAEPFCRLR